MKKTRFMVLLGVLVLSLSFVSIVLAGANAAQNAVARDPAPNIEIYTYDFGDAIDPPYPTLLSNNGAYHAIDGRVYLGRTVDAESDGNPTTNATGDDNLGIDDEDGIIFNTPLVPGVNAQVTVEASGEGFLNAWIDFNLDQDFDDNGEHIIQEFPMMPGFMPLEFFVPPDSHIGEVFARFRLSNVPEIPYWGYGEMGEVEDYHVRILENIELGSIEGYKRHDLDGDGIHDEGEESLPGWVIHLTGDDIHIETVTDENGLYSFQDIPPGTYFIEEELQPGWEQIYPTSGYYTLTLTTGEQIGGMNFGNRRSSAIWEKYLNDWPWESPEVTVSYEISDYLEVVDIVHLPDPLATFTLTEEWDPAHLELVNWEVTYGEPVIDLETGLMSWIVPPDHPEMLVLRKLFHVLPCDWEITRLSETLEGVTVDHPQRNFYIEKLLSDLYIDGEYAPEVLSGEYANFTLLYGNSGFAESDVTVRTDLPPEAPFVNANPFPDRWDAAAGSWAEWDVGLLSSATDEAVDVTVAIVPELQISTTFEIQNEIRDHLDTVQDFYSFALHVTEPPRAYWSKWVDGEPWQPGIERTVETSDTVTVVDVIEAPSEEPFTLYEEWIWGQLELVDFEVSFGDVITDDAALVWELPPGHPPTVEITKIFHVEPCNWESTVLREILFGIEVAYPERPVIINKRGHDLHLSEVHYPEVFPGDIANFTLIYSNDGGYENEVLIVNEFPPEAPFLSSVPEPTSVEPPFVTWELGDLSTGSEGSIEVMVQISEEVVPSTTITITDYIIDHTGEVVEDVSIEYHVNEFTGYSWEKWINGQPWTPGITVRAETSDTIIVEDVIYREAFFDEQLLLHEAFDRNELGLLDWQVTPITYGEVTATTDFLYWDIGPGGPQVLTLTKWFHVEPSTWQETILSEDLLRQGNPLEPEIREITIQKIPPDLWIDSLYVQDVLPNQVVPFTLVYGNDGGYENDVLIVNQFPPEAPFISSIPAPTSVDPPWVYWELGDLSTGTGGAIEVTVQIQDGLQVSSSIEILDWIYNHELDQVDVVATTFHVTEEGERYSDLGDAPDSTNHAGVLMTAYHFPPMPPIMATYPTVYDPATGWPSGPKHLNPRGDAWLGEWVTLEYDADLPPDEDGPTNVDPHPDVPDLDLADDGLWLPGSLPDCVPTVLTYTVTVPPGAPPVDRFANVWIDWNRDGDWGDTFTCEQQGDAPEWAVQNHLLPSLPPGFHLLQIPVFLPYNKAPGLPTWTRIALATEPAPSSPDGSPPDGRGPENGYLFGETEDYLIAGVEPAIPEWEKWIEVDETRIPWEPDLVLRVETSDTIKVVDVFHGGAAFTLVESWNPAHLELEKWSADPEEGVVVDPAGNFLYWVVVPDHPETITMTKWFHIKESTWLDTFLDERLLVEGEVVDVRPVPILKRPPVLWINSSYEREVQAGNVVPFLLQFGNDGGFENDVTIRNEFPPEAPFVETFPPPTSWDPAGLWAEWELSGLGTGVSGEIEVYVEINPELVPSTTIEIWDWIYNHIDEPVDAALTLFHVDFPPVSSLFGHKWFDLNNNGERDLEEPGLPEWEIFASGDNGVEVSTSTDENGNYRFLNLPVSSYTVTEEIKDGWTQTYPQEGHHVVVVHPGEHVEGLDFGNYQSLIGWVDGYVYDAELPGNQPTCNPANVLAIPGGVLVPADLSTGYYGPQPLLENTYTLIANAPGYSPKNALVDVIRSVTTTQDFHLPRPMIVISPTSVPVTVTIDVGETFPYPIDIENDGHLPLEFEMIELGGVDIPWISEDPISGTIPSLGSQQVDVTLTCSEAGFFTGTLGIMHNDPCQPQIEIPHELTCREPQQLTWEKSIDGITWTPGLTVSRQTSDTIEVVDTFSGAGDFTLVENWDGAGLDLSGWELVPEGIGEIDEAGTSLYWVVPEDRPETVTITKWFHVEPSTWRSTTLAEVVWVDQEPIMEREVTVLKVPPQLWIDSDYPPNVHAGETVTFTLVYGNDGGYENDVTIRNEFPSSAPFLFAVPFPDRVGQDGNWVEWDLGDLSMSSMDTIEVEAAVLSGVQPSTTIEITDVILNHLGEVMDGTTISLHVDESTQRDDDIYMMDNPLDDGSVPSSVPWWESVDLWVRIDGNCSNTAHQNPVGGQTNTVCARVRNRMSTTVNNIDIAVYYANAALGMSWPTSWTPIGTANIFSLAGYAEIVVSIPWNTPNTTGHFCMLVRANALEDPVGIGPDTMTPADLPQNNNNITMRNMEIVRFPEITNCSQITTDVYTDVVTLDVVNTTGEPVVVDIFLESEDYPLDTGDLRVDPGNLWGIWNELTNFDQVGMNLIATDFPASIQGIALSPYQHTPITITITAEVGVRFTLRVSEQVENQLVGGVTYVREVPYCVYLPLILRSSAPGPANAFDPLLNGWAGWVNYLQGFRWLEVLNRAGYYVLFKPGG